MRRIAWADFTRTRTPIGDRIEPYGRACVGGTGTVVRTLRGLGDVNAFSLGRSSQKKNDYRQPTIPTTYSLFSHEIPPGFVEFFCSVGNGIKFLSLINRQSY
jgi:hypothetical protein